MSLAHQGLTARLVASALKLRKILRLPLAGRCTGEVSLEVACFCKPLQCLAARPWLSKSRVAHKFLSQPGQEAKNRRGKICAGVSRRSGQVAFEECATQSVCGGLVSPGKVRTLPAVLAVAGLQCQSSDAEPYPHPLGSRSVHLASLQHSFTVLPRRGFPARAGGLSTSQLLSNLHVPSLNKRGQAMNSPSSSRTRRVYCVEDGHSISWQYLGSKLISGSSIQSQTAICNSGRH